MSADDGDWPGGERGVGTRPINAMSDSALEHAIETAESAQRSAEHLVDVLPVPDEPEERDVDSAWGKAGAAHHRLESLVRCLRAERSGRNNHSLEEYADGGDEQ